MAAAAEGKNVGGARRARCWGGASSGPQSPRRAVPVGRPALHAGRPQPAAPDESQPREAPAQPPPGAAPAGTIRPDRGGLAAPPALPSSQPSPTCRQRGLPQPAGPGVGSLRPSRFSGSRLRRPWSRLIYAAAARGKRAAPPNWCRTPGGERGRGLRS